MSTHGAVRAYVYGIDGRAVGQESLHSRLSMTVTSEVVAGGSGSVGATLSHADTTERLRNVTVSRDQGSRGRGFPQRQQTPSFAIPALAASGMKHATTRIGVGIDGHVDDGRLECENLFPVGTAGLSAHILGDVCGEGCRETNHEDGDGEWEWALCRNHAHVRLYSRAPPAPEQGRHWEPALSGIVVLVSEREARAFDAARASGAAHGMLCEQCGAGGGQLGDATRGKHALHKFLRVPAPYVANIKVTRAMASDVMRASDMLWQSGEPGEPIDQVRFPPGFRRAIAGEYRSGGYTDLTEDYWVNLARACLLVRAPEFAAYGPGAPGSAEMPFGGHGRVHEDGVAGAPARRRAAADPVPRVALAPGRLGAPPDAASGDVADWDIGATVAGMSPHGVRLLAAAMASYVTDCGEYATDRMFTMAAGGARQEISDNLMPYQAVSPPSGDCENSAEVIACLLRAMQDFTASNGGAAAETGTMRRIVGELAGWDVAVVAMTSRNASMAKGAGEAARREATIEESTGGYKAHIIAALLPPPISFASVTLARLHKHSFAEADQRAEENSAGRGHRRNRDRVPLFLEGTCWAHHCLPDSHDTAAEAAAERAFSRTRASRVMSDVYAPAGGSAFDFYSKFVAAIVLGDEGKGEYKLICRSVDGDDRAALTARNAPNYSGQAFANGVDARAFANDYDRVVRFVDVPLSTRSRDAEKDERVLRSYVESLYPPPRNAFDPAPEDREANDHALEYAHAWCQEQSRVTNASMAIRADAHEGASHWVMRRRRLDGTGKHVQWLVELGHALERDAASAHGLLEVALVAAAPSCGVVVVTCAFRVAC